MTEKINIKSLQTVLYDVNSVRHTTTQIYKKIDSNLSNIVEFKTEIKYLTEFIIPFHQQYEQTLFEIIYGLNQMFFKKIMKIGYINRDNYAMEYLDLDKPNISDEEIKRRLSILSSHYYDYVFSNAETHYYMLDKVHIKQQMDIDKIIDDGIMLFGKTMNFMKNKCYILCDEYDNIIINNYGSYNKIYFLFDSQEMYDLTYLAVNVRDINYHRKKKLMKLDSFSEE